ncbi:hypothetical protein [Conexibacter woesei]|uniref:Uncharacterized protein n=1 Tax=Conexibacter woesei (strain DSM 14684 / CCUG 47730 / CIP 108061 / JCM 11494 / NBRC 100937 / ID131577) TaxID=469383 RepID=D3FDZ7_CONWI|nr:hypothetical protein [Conexibacter woesei]ADB51613.1 hypothetical protein Cwoe_3194 [Conexibacter woesei DSM 14684]
MTVPAADDPLARLAEQLERLSSANLALGEAAEQLIAHARDERLALREAARGARSAARAAAAASAQTHALADDPRRG